ncbi:hypothetical protein ABH906_003825 [Pseudomonas frederiksbergensis]
MSAYIYMKFHAHNFVWIFIDIKLTNTKLTNWNVKLIILIQESYKNNQFM